MNTQGFAIPKPKDQRRGSLRVGLAVYPDGREVCDQEGRAGKREYSNRLLLMWERQRHRCRICLKPLSLDRATFDHENGRGSGGSRRDDRITRLIEGVAVWQNGAVCGSCNTRKGSVRGYPPWPFAGAPGAKIPFGEL